MDVYHCAPNLPTRPLGKFLLQGKTQSVRLYELMVEGDERGASRQDFNEKALAFGEIVTLIDQFEVNEALRVLRAFMQRFPQDGPGKYLQMYLESMAAERRDEQLGNWDGVVVVGQK
jgi:hypothetical protein